MTEHRELANSFKEGDLIEARKGETVMRGQLMGQGEGGGSPALVLTIALRCDVAHLLANGYEVRLIAPALPKTPGHYASPNGELWTLHQSRQWFAHGDGSLAVLWATSEVADLSFMQRPVDRLEVIGAARSATSDKERTADV